MENFKLDIAQFQQDHWTEEEVKKRDNRCRFCTKVDD